jgi:hypothetical protein
VPAEADLKRIVDNTASWHYDPVADVYVVEGKARTARWVRQYVERNIVGSIRVLMREATDQMRLRVMTVADWHAYMLALVEVLHKLAALAATGDAFEAVPDAERDLERTIAHEAGYLAVFRQHVDQAMEQNSVADGAMGTALAAAAGLAVAAARWVTRAGSYADAGLITFERHRYYLMVATGFTDARRVLNEAEHCDGCLREASKGWVPIGQLVPLGYEQCGQWCKCDVEYRRVEVPDAWGRINPDIRRTEWTLPR